MPERRQISGQEKEAVLTRQGLRCFIDNHPVESEMDLEFDHLRPHTHGGMTTVDNIGAVCRKHNREKSSLYLAEYRDRLTVKRFFEGAKKRRLDDLLQERLSTSGYGQRLNVEMDVSHITLFLESGPTQLPLAECPATHEKYFFATLPVSLLRNDTELQPRALEPDRL